MAATETAPAPAAAEEAKAPKAPGIMMPLLAVFVLMPAIAYGLTEYVLIPKLRAAIPAATPAEAGGLPAKKGEGKAEAAPAAKSAPKKAEGGEGKKGAEAGADNTFEFKDVIVNLSGALGTRYLKTSFTVSGSDSHLPDVIKENQKKLLDITISVLSARTLNDLDSPTAKNAIREELIAKFNHSLGVEMVEEIYFSEFVIQ